MNARYAHRQPWRYRPTPYEAWVRQMERTLLRLAVEQAGGIVMALAKSRGLLP